MHPEHAHTNFLAVAGSADVYLIDQVMRRAIAPGMKVLDAGCGSGRNAAFLLRLGIETWGVDSDEGALRRARETAAMAWAEVTAGMSPQDWATQHFVRGSLTGLPFPDRHFDAAVCCAVLHFCASREEVEGALTELARVLRPDGLLFVRVATLVTLDTGGAGQPAAIGGGRYRMTDGKEWLLLGGDELAALERAIGLTRHESLKTTNVDGRRAMTTWVMRKPDA